MLSLDRVISGSSEDLSSRRDNAVDSIVDNVQKLWGKENCIWFTMSDAVMLWDWYSTRVEPGSCLRQWFSGIWRSPPATWQRSWSKSLDTVEKTVMLRVLCQTHSEWCSRWYNRLPNSELSASNVGVQLVQWSAWCEKLWCSEIGIRCTMSDALRFSIKYTISDPCCLVQLFEGKSKRSFFTVCRWLKKRRRRRKICIGEQRASAPWVNRKIHFQHQIREPINERLRITPSLFSTPLRCTVRAFDGKVTAD